MTLRRRRIVLHLLLLQQLLVLELLYTLLLVHEHVILACVVLGTRNRIFIRGEQGRLEHRLRLVLLLLVVEHLIRLGLQVDHVLVRSTAIDLIEPSLFQG